MKRFFMYIFLVLFTRYSQGQNTVLCRISPGDPNVVQIKWYCPKLLNTKGCNVYRKEATTGNWERLNAEPILPLSYNIPDEDLKKDKELKDYLLLASDPENIKGLAFLAALIKSFKSEAFANYLGIRYDDKNAVPGKAYFYKVSAITSSGEQELAISKEIIFAGYSPIAAPKNITIKTGNKKVSFKWDPEPDEYFGVNIYRKASDTGVFRKITKDPIILSKTKNKKEEEVYGEEFFVDAKLKPHVNYVYHLEALDFFGAASHPSKPILVTLKDLDPPKSPDSIYNTVNGKTVSIKWKKRIKEEDLLGFNIYRTNKSDTDFVKLNKQPLCDKDSVFLDQAPHFGSYMYAVSCIDTDSNETVSNPFHVEVYDNDPPLKPENLTIRSDSGRLILNWDKNKEEDLKGYLIYRTINKNTAETYVKLTPDPVANTTYTDVLSKNIKNKFLYKVVAVDKSLNRSPYSDFAIARMPDITAPNAPFLKTISQNERKYIVIEWIPNAEPDLAGYLIYRKYLNDSLDSFKKLNARVINKTSSRYTDRSAEAPGRYEYYLQAIDSSGNVSNVSNHLHVKLKPGMEEDQVQIADFKAQYQSRQQQVLIKWKLKNEADMKGSIVYKYKSNETDFSPITGLMEDMTFADKDVRPGENYTYQLRVYDRKGDISKSEKITLTIK